MVKMKQNLQRMAKPEEATEGGRIPDGAMKKGEGAGI